MKKHGVSINENNRFLTFRSDICLHRCLFSNRSSKVFNRTRSRSRSKFKSYERTSFDCEKDNECAVVSAEVFLIMIERKNHDVVILWFKHFEQLNQFEKIDKYLAYSNVIADLSVISTDDYEKFFVKHDRPFVTMNELKQRISKEFHRYVDVWNSKLASKVLSHRKWDHVINFKSEAKSSIKKAYGLFKDQTTVMKKYIDDMLEKDYIKFSTFEYAASILIVKKFEEKLRVCVNYRALNALTIKNRNASFFIRNTLIRLCFVKYFNKFDIIAAFNEIRMREGDEKKIAFLTRYDLFEYVIMFFELCNASRTF